MKETCEFCKWWFERDNDSEFGTCRRLPPVLVPGVAAFSASMPGGHGGYNGYYDAKFNAECDAVLGPWAWAQPTTRHEDLCGEWRVR
jgi:hypothetical protein